METRAKIIELANEAISRGFGSYFCLPKVTWTELKAGYESGKRFDDSWEARLLAASKGE